MLFYFVCSKIGKKKGKEMYTIEEFDQQKTKILKYILYQKRTEQQIRKKFESAVEENMLEDIIEYLKEAKYINDSDYIEKTVQNFILLKNLSIKELQYKLITKGLNKNDIEDYFYKNKEELEEYEIKSAKNIINKKINAIESEEIKQYLLKKGYRMENIKQAMEE
ncbi:MAG: RecX family transcriptional regulator [Clostridia bacterium]|nr:RecX family transcriptional regulator [Clostridia bacterium]